MIHRFLFVDSFVGGMEPPIILRCVFFWWNENYPNNIKDSKLTEFQAKKHIYKNHLPRILVDGMWCPAATHGKIQRMPKTLGSTDRLPAGNSNRPCLELEHRSIGNPKTTS